MSDIGHEWTDQKIDELAAKIHNVYVQAANEMEDKLANWMADYEKQRLAREKALKAGVITKEEYKKWLSDRAMERSWQQNMINQLSYDAVNCDVLCRQMINDEIPTVFAENANMEAYNIVRSTGLDLSFTIYDRDAVRFLLTDPEIYRGVDIPKDLQWNQKKFASAMMQSVLQGESIPNTAKRLNSVFKMGAAASVMVARTSMTYIESRAKQNSMARALAMGIPIVQMWKALHDGRTRYEHRQMDGVTANVGEKFNVDGYMMTGPGDPTAPPYLICNCRCNVTNEIGYEDIPPRVTINTDKFPSDVTYEQWKSGTYRTDKDGKETASSKKERGIK